MNNLICPVYRCWNCGAEFEEPTKYVEDTGEFWGRPYTEYYDGCPKCKEHISDADRIRDDEEDDTDE